MLTYVGNVVDPSAPTSDELDNIRQAYKECCWHVLKAIGEMIDKKISNQDDCELVSYFLL